MGAHAGAEAAATMQLEVALLAAVAHYAWTWPKLAASTAANREAGTGHLQRTAA